ncbi:MAG: hypothetical protein ACO3X1_13020, partial [Burkholderiaceae bacterium]
QNWVFIDSHRARGESVKRRPQCPFDPATRVLVVAAALQVFRDPPAAEPQAHGPGVLGAR